MTDEEKSIAHRAGMNQYGESKYPDNLVPWRSETPPVWPAADANHATGRLRSCWYCGSMHPADVAAAIKAGAQAHWADHKYGWPHKLSTCRTQRPRIAPSSRHTAAITSLSPRAEWPG